ncbi:hypothetical protein [Hymenobacter algoricola]|uniref:DUF5007 domain-containing protein n=1 Tax=Hymenobacter algoricola TaxID=486267 RepID=A0ABP7N489_9BACT
MRYRLLLFAPLILLAACSKENGGPRLDLVGSARYTSTNRTLTRAGDTVTFKLFSDVRDAEKLLKHIRIFVTYSPVKNPLSYPASGYDPTTAKSDTVFTYLDSTVSAKEFVLQTTLNARTTSGREQWAFEAEDVDGNKVSRGFRLQYRNPDSLRSYHSYTAQLQAPGGSTARRSFLALLPGLTLPRYTITTNAEAKRLVDVVYVVRNSSIFLAAPNDPFVNHIGRWSTRPTEFRDPNLNKASFDNAITGDALTTLFNGAAALLPTTRTPALAKEQVYAFRTANQKSGLIYVQDIIATPVPTLILLVKVTK